MNVGRPWAESFLRRHTFVKRRRMKAARAIPANFEDVNMSFYNSIKDVRVTNKLDDSLVVNIDQTGLKLAPTASYTMEEKCWLFIMITITFLHETWEIKLVLFLCSCSHSYTSL